ncbi:MAG: exo-alpha-sialidase [Candidatus Kapabacteria bacterium]|nr:exo-alpha-sialidase [Candidatus Kapabacteria bacterium]
MKHLLGVALLFCAVIANAQTLLWKPLLGPQVGFNKVIAFNGDTTLCNLFSSPMLVMTTDRGKTWIQHGNTLFDTEQQHFWYQNGIITVFAGETLFRSKDWGASWSSSGMPLAVHKSYLNGDTLIITQRVDSFVAVSTSGGNSWETKKLSRRVLFIHMGMLFSRDSTGLHRSSDMGETWQRIRTYTPGNPERFTYTSSTNGIVEVENRDSLLATNLEFYDGIISVSSDGGTKWGEVHRSEPNTLSFIVRIQESIFLYSHEYNKSNIRISIIDISGSPALKELGVYPSSSYMIRNINATDVVISNSSNSTKNTLYPQSGKPVPLNQTSLNTEIGSALYLRDMNIFYAQNSELIHHSTNGGTTWTTINTNAKLQSSPFNIACNLAVPDDSTIALTASPQRGLTSQPTLTVVTSNGGKKWTTYSVNSKISYAGF